MSKMTVRTVVPGTAGRSDGAFEGLVVVGISSTVPPRVAARVLDRLAASASKDLSRRLSATFFRDSKCHLAVTPTVKAIIDQVKKRQNRDAALSRRCSGDGLSAR